jgi:hypothetical protein
VADSLDDFRTSLAFPQQVLLSAVTLVAWPIRPGSASVTVWAAIALAFVL